MHDYREGADNFMVGAGDDDEKIVLTAAKEVQDYINASFSQFDVEGSIEMWVTFARKGEVEV